MLVAAGVTRVLKELCELRQLRMSLHHARTGLLYDISRPRAIIADKMDGRHKLLDFGRLRWHSPHT